MGVNLANSLIDGVIVTPQKRISVPEGDVFHAMKRDEVGYCGFGEAYFSTIKLHAIKAWKRHRKMTLNLIVPVGSIRFAIYDDRPKSGSYGLMQQIVLSPENYCRLTIAPMLWVGFQGIGLSPNLLLNLANMPHIPEESDRCDRDAIRFDWEALQI